MKDYNILNIIGLFSLLFVAIIVTIKTFKKNESFEFFAPQDTKICLPKNQFSNLVEVKKDLNDFGAIPFPTIDERFFCYQLKTRRLKDFDKLGYQYIKK